METRRLIRNIDSDNVNDESCESSEVSSLLPNEDAQNGVKQVEAITLTWTKNSLIVAYASILLVHFVNSLQTSITSNLTPYVVSDFGLHSLISVIEVVSSLLGGILRLPTAKILDTWGRCEGFAAMVFVSTLGLVLMAVCRDVQTYAAAQVFYSVGFTGVSYVLNVVVADTSSLQNRALAFAFQSSPYIITAFMGPSAAEWFYKTAGFRWAFVTFSIVTPLMCLPIFGLLYYHQRKAEKEGLLVHTSSDRTFWESFCYYSVEFDAVGVILLSTGLILFLLPFSLASSAKSTWHAPHILAMLITGTILLLQFILYERFMAPKPYLPFALLTSPTVIGACILDAVIFVGFYCWDGYYTSYLQVVHNLSIAEAGYIGNIYSIGSCFSALIAGYLIRVSGRFKWLAWLALPLQVLGGTLMIFLRQPDTPIAQLILPQLLIALSGGTLIITSDIAIMSLSSHAEIASLLALLALAANIGGAVGGSVSGAIWTNILPRELLKELPEEWKGDAWKIYEDLQVQLSFPVGSVVREAIIKAYAVTQFWMCVAGTLVLGIGFVGVALWRDVRVGEKRQVKGVVF
ncbi:major facilitator superfamily transporter [Tricladium varicosporioides]|nr:major facilitator superfamily transporter [Hymenoscyphus varicosporioides]